MEIDVPYEVIKFIMVIFAIAIGLLLAVFFGPQGVEVFFKDVLGFIIRGSAQT